MHPLSISGPLQKKKLKIEYFIVSLTFCVDRTRRFSAIERRQK
jgi:hypothetical protein